MILRCFKRIYDVYRILSHVGTNVMDPWWFPNNQMVFSHDKHGIYLK